MSSGKTVGSLIAWLLFIEEGPPGNLLMIGKTERTLRRNILDVIEELLGPDDYRLNAGSGEATIFGRKVYLVGANDERAEQKIRGISLVGAYGDEVTLWPESFWSMLLSRLRQVGARFYGTTNPDSPAHWLKRGYLDRVDELNLTAFQFELDDNPALDPEYVAALKTEYTGLWYQRFILGLWVAAEGAVYDMFDETVHCVDTLPKLVDSFAGCDYGTSNATVFQRLSVGDDNVLYLHDEWRHDGRSGRQMTDAEYSHAFRDWAQNTANLRQLQSPWPHWTYIDPSAASFRLQLWRDGVPGITEADNAVIDGIRDVSMLISSGRLKIHRPTCKALIEEIQGYRWDEKAQRRGEDKPIKQADHSVDATRYVVRGTEHIWRRWLGARYHERAA